MQTIKLIRTDASHQDFKNLVDQLNAYLSMVDGDEHAFYHQYNGIENLKNVVVAYLDHTPVGCGAFKAFDSSSVEIKRMYTEPSARNFGIASQILEELEHWALEENYKHTILETGKRQMEAVKFYQKNNYATIPNFGPYQGVENSICFIKNLNEQRQ